MLPVIFVSMHIILNATHNIKITEQQNSKMEQQLA
jgi:hypothetical protein